MELAERVGINFFSSDIARVEEKDSDKWDTIIRQSVPAGTMFLPKDMQTKESEQIMVLVYVGMDPKTYDHLMSQGFQ